MTTAPVGGHEGPYHAPITVAQQSVLPEWIDYNGHMNVGYYGLAFDRAIDQLFDQQLGNGEAYVRAAKQGLYVLQSHISFLHEMHKGQGFSASFQLVDHDAKRLHFWSELWADGRLCATQEVLAMNVDHQTRRSTSFPDWLHSRLKRMLADHAQLPRPTGLGAGLGIRRS